MMGEIDTRVSHVLNRESNRTQHEWLKRPNEMFENDVILVVLCSQLVRFVDWS